MNKIFKYLCLGLSMLFVASCADWTEPERTEYDNQKGLSRYIPLIEATDESQLTPTEREHFASIREYRKTPHVMGFGWFGNWTGKGKDPMKYLKMLPDSVDMVSIWGIQGNFSEEHIRDLRFFQQVKGGKAMLCWIVQDIGDQLTPNEETAHDYWVVQKGGGIAEEGARAYARAICDTIEKYGFDGFDIDYEPNYGHSSRNTQAPIAHGSKSIGPNSGQNTVMYAFIKELHDRLKPAGRILAMDGEPGLLTTETSKMIDYYIYQAYWERFTSSVRSKVTKPHLDNWKRKTIITVEFEQHWKTGTVSNYYSERTELIPPSSLGAQIKDYAALDLEGGIRVAGIGSYHMEYDIEGGPYRWLREALHFGNQVVPGKFEE